MDALVSKNTANGGEEKERERERERAHENIHPTTLISQTAVTLLATTQQITHNAHQAMENTADISITNSYTCVNNIFMCACGVADTSQKGYITTDHGMF